MLFRSLLWLLSLDLVVAATADRDEFRTAYRMNGFLDYLPFIADCERAKLGDDPKKPKWLYTVHGVGYRFEAPAKTDKSDEK